MEPRGEDETDSTAPVIRVPAALTPIASTRAFLIVVAGKSSVGRMFPVTDELVIGRSGSAHLVLEDEGVSRRHARVRPLASGNFELEDLGSTNGTFFQGERIKSRVLRDGDKVQIGNDAVLKFSHQDQLDEALQKNLYESATRDSLTQLHNAKYFREALAHEFAYSRRHQIPVAVLMVDVDHFKKINDSHGHPAGDAVLAALGHVLAGQVRVEDVVSRYGGEEFAVMLRQATQEASNKCAERIRAAVEMAEFRHEAAYLPVTVSIGVANTATSPAGSATELVAAADELLYRAKRSGRNRVEGCWPA